MTTDVEPRPRRFVSIQARPKIFTMPTRFLVQPRPKVWRFVARYGVLWRRGAFCGGVRGGICGKQDKNKRSFVEAFRLGVDDKIV